MLKIVASTESSGHEATDGARERGAESSGEIKGGGSWKVFDTAEGHVIVVSVARGHRVKARLPKTLTTIEQRRRFAIGAAPTILADAVE